MHPNKPVEFRRSHKYVEPVLGVVKIQQGLIFFMVYIFIMLKVISRFCPNPFIGLHVYNKYYLCCPGWLNTPIGNLDEDPMDVWNGDKAHAIRRSIIDGSFNFCSKCPVLDSMVGRKIDVGFDYRDGPKAMNLSHDRSCNLKCSFCRTGVIQAKGKEFDRLKNIQDRLMERFGHKLEQLTITGAGDAFGSKLYLGLLRSMRSEDYPNLRITLCTNGLLVDKCWDSILGISKSVQEISVSVDAASAETYRKNRGANWDVLVRNLRFISDIKESQEIKFVLRYCAQENNWREMKDFVLLAKSLNVDKVIFQSIKDLGTMDDYTESAIHLPNHEDYQGFLKMLENPVFQDPIVKMFNFKKIGLFNERNNSESDFGVMSSDRLLENAGHQEGKNRELVQIEM